MIRYYRILENYFGEASVVLRIEAPRELYRDGIRVAMFTGFLAAGIMVLFTLALFFFTSRTLIRPWRRLSAAMEAITPDTEAIDASCYYTKEPYVLAVSANDMLARLRQSKQQLEHSSVSMQVLSSMLNGIDADLYVSDPGSGELLFINDRMKERFALGNDAVGKPLREVFKTAAPGMDVALSGTPNTLTWEEEDPETGRYYQNVSRLIDWAGGLQVRLQISTDITDLIEARHQAEAGSKAKGEFLSRMSHEMRTPMNAIIGMTNIAQKSDDPEKKKYCLDRIDTASKHLLGVINDILDMSKIEAGKFELYPAEFNFKEMLENTVSVLAFRAEERRQELSLHLDVDIPRLLYGDDQRLAQVVTNLLGNAIKFTPEGGKISLKTHCESLTESACILRIEVADNGIGMTREQQERLFTSFEQADGSIARKYGGTGLGLAITKRIVEMMEGEIYAESSLGVGSTFIVTVRLVVLGGVPGQKDDMRAAAGRPAHMESGIPYDFSGRTLLIAEDLEINREVLAAMLENTKAELRHAATGAEALAMFRQQPEQYDLIFMDVQMPEMDGYEATRQIRALPFAKAASIPIIAMTANVFREDIEQCLACGMNAHIGKPLSFSEVEDVLQRFL